MLKDLCILEHNLFYDFRHIYPMKIGIMVSPIIKVKKTVFIWGHQRLGMICPVQRNYITYVKNP